MIDCFGLVAKGHTSNDIGQGCQYTEGLFEGAGLDLNPLPPCVHLEQTPQQSRPVGLAERLQPA